MRSHSDGVRSDVYRIPMLIGESESLYNCKMHDLSSFNQRSHFLNRLSDIPGVDGIGTKSNTAVRVAPQTDVHRDFISRLEAVGESGQLSSITALYQTNDVTALELSSELARWRPELGEH